MQEKISMQARFFADYGKATMILSATGAATEPDLATTV